MQDEIDLTYARLRDDHFWSEMAPEEGRILCEAARKSVQLELALIEQDRMDYKAIAREPGEFREAMAEFGQRRRKALIFLNLVEQRQAHLKLRKVREMRWAINQHRLRTVRDGIEPTEHDTDLWEVAGGESEWKSE